MAGTDNSYAAATVYIERSAYAVEMDKRRLEPASARSRRLPRGALLSYPVRTSGQPGQMLSLRLSHGRLAGAALPAKGEVAQRKVPALALTPSRSNASREGSSRATKYGSSSIFSDELASQLQAAAAAGITAQTVGGSTSPAATRSLSLRPLTTFVNVLVTGGNQHVGKVPWHTVSKGPKGEETLVYSNPHEAFMQDASPWATSLKPVVLPEACREMVYTFQDTPGPGSAMAPSTHLECLLEFVLKKQAADYKKLGGCRGLHKSVACGSLEHSPTVCIFELPPEGPARVDLLTMSVVGQHVAVLPVLNGMGMRHDVAEERHQLVKRMLKSPGVYIENLGSIEMFRSPKAEWLSSGSALLLQDGGHAVKDIVELFMSDPVYDMLDNAWDRYNNFCEKYEKAGNDVNALLAAEMQASACVLDDIKARDEAAKANDDVEKAKKLMLVLWELGRGYSRSGCYGPFDQQHHSLCTAQGFRFPRDEKWIKSMWPCK